MNRDGRRRTAFELLAFPDITVEPPARALARSWAASRRRSPRSSKSTRATTSISAARTPTSRPTARTKPSPFRPALDYRAIAGLSTELRQKLEQARPASLAQAARIDGMTPAALMLVLAQCEEGAAAPLGVRWRRAACKQASGGPRIFVGLPISPRPLRFHVKLWKSLKSTRNCLGSGSAPSIWSRRRRWMTCGTDILPTVRSSWRGLPMQKSGSIWAAAGDSPDL